MVLGLLVFFVAAVRAEAAMQILVLHSYSQDYAWTRGQHEGFSGALKNLPVLSTEYLDTKRRPYDEAYAGMMADYLGNKYAGYRPAAIYVSDDNALLFARDHLRRLFPDAPVFFSGVNDFAVRRSLDPQYFTGVFEKKEVRPNLEWLLHQEPELRNLVFVGDGSNTHAAAICNGDKKPFIPASRQACRSASNALAVMATSGRCLAGTA